MVHVLLLIFEVLICTCMTDLVRKRETDVMSDHSSMLGCALKVVACHMFFFNFVFSFLFYIC